MTLDLAPLDLAIAFRDHLAQRQRDAEAALARTGFDTLVISSGQHFVYFADDREASFYAVPHFLHWCPLEGPHHVIKVQPRKRQTLTR